MIEKMSEVLDKNYGDFSGSASITRRLKLLMQGTPNWDKLDPPMTEALDAIAHELGRILNGNFRYKDSWRDIAFYAALVDELLGK